MLFMKIVFGYSDNYKHWNFVFCLQHSAIISLWNIQQLCFHWRQTVFSAKCNRIVRFILTKFRTQNNKHVTRISVIYNKYISGKLAELSSVFSIVLK
jgi:hypothetical protein